MSRAFCVVPIALLLCSCGSNKEAAPVPAAGTQPAVASTSVSKHKYAKLIELGGFRITEKAPGRLQIVFGVVNHSIADLGDVGMNVTLKASAAKEDDPPLASFPCQVTLGPLEWKDVTVEIPTKLRVYELPDWQFVRATYEITSPTL